MSVLVMAYGKDEEEGDEETWLRVTEVDEFVFEAFLGDLGDLTLEAVDWRVVLRVLRDRDLAVILCVDFLFSVTKWQKNGMVRRWERIYLTDLLGS